MAKIMNKFFIICLIVNSIMLLLLPFAACSSSPTSLSAAADVLCKELNQWNCYSSKNSGNYCNSKDENKAETRWYYDKGHCRKFAYKGCNGNRNRFCTKDTCMKRCKGE